MSYGIMTQKRHRHLPSSALAWFRLHFRASGFNGRFQIGFRRPESPSILPLTTQPMDKLPDFVESAHFSRRMDYYITANSVAGVQRRKEGLFSLHNIVIDIDLHVKEDFEAPANTIKERMFYNQELLHALLSRFQDAASTEDRLPLPTSVVWTGRGLQLWWAIIPMSRKCLTWYEEIRDTLILRIQNLIEEYSSELGDLKVDGAASKNAVGYFRLPGTVNSHSQTLVKAEIWSGEQYDTHELIKWAKEYTKEQAAEEEVKPLPHPDVDPFSYSDAEVRILKNVFTLAFFRVRQMIRLRAIRNDEIGNETRNNMCLVVFNALLLSSGEEKAWEKIQEFNAGFKNPMTEKELHNSLDTSVRKGGYRYKNETILSFLDISASEQEQIGLYPGGSPFPRLSSHPSRVAARRLAKQHRNDRIKELSMSGKKNKEIAEELGISPNTVTTVLGAKRPRREEALDMKKAGMLESDIAAELGVSTRTVERYLETKKVEATDDESASAGEKETISDESSVRQPELPERVSPVFVCRGTQWSHGPSEDIKWKEKKEKPPPTNSQKKPYI